jgi:hypothetical protein
MFDIFGREDEPSLGHRNLKDFIDIVPVVVAQSGGFRVLRSRRKASWIDSWWIEGVLHHNCTQCPNSQSMVLGELLLSMMTSS